MKQHYSLFVLAVLLLASPALLAQSFSFSVDGVTYGKNDTINITIGHGIMQEAEGPALTNNGPRPTTAKLSCLPLEDSPIIVSGICTSNGGGCLPGNTSKEFTIASGETYEGISIEFDVDNSIPNGTSANFLLISFDTMKRDVDTTNSPYTFLKITVNDASIASLSQAGPAITLYPNPSTDMVFVESESSLLNYEIAIFSIKGDEVIRQKANGDSRQQVDVKALPNGTYFLTLISDNNICRTRKFIIAK